MDVKKHHLHLKPKAKLQASVATLHKTNVVKPSRNYLISGRTKPLFYCKTKKKKTPRLIPTDEGYVAITSLWPALFNIYFTRTIRINARQHLILYKEHWETSIPMKIIVFFLNQARGSHDYLGLMSVGQSRLDIEGNVLG